MTRHTKKSKNRKSSSTRKRVTKGGYIPPANYRNEWRNTQAGLENAKLKLKQYNDMIQKKTTQPYTPQELPYNAMIQKQTTQPYTTQALPYSESNISKRELIQSRSNHSRNLEYGRKVFNDFQRQLNSARNELAVAQAKINASGLSAANRNAAIKERNSIKAEISNISSKMAKVEKERNTAQKERDNAIAAHQANLDRGAKEWEVYYADLQKTKDELAAAQAKVNASGLSAANRNAAIKERNAIKAEISNISSKMSNAERERNSAQKERNNAIAARKANLELGAQQWAEYDAELKRTQEALNATSRESAQKAAELLGQQKAAEDAAKEAKRELEELKAQLSNKNLTVSERNFAKKEAEEAKKHAQETLAELEKIKQDLEQKRLQADKNRANANSAKAKAEEERIKKSQNKLSNLNNQVSNIERLVKTFSMSKNFI
jgi:chromosome segregation ATPase